jgi:hypothetical protein
MRSSQQNIVDWRDVSNGVVRGDLRSHATRDHTAKHSILSTAPQLCIAQKALGTLPKDCNVIPKHVGATIHT